MENIISQESVTSKSKDIRTVESTSPIKFIVLCILSFGFYQLWWIYKSWRFFDVKDNLQINSAFRTLLSIFFLIPLFDKIYNYASEFGYSKFYSSILFYFGIILFDLISYAEGAPLLLIPLTVIFYLYPFIALNHAINKDTSCHLKVLNKFNTRQLVVVILGSFLWFYIILLIF